MAAPSPQQPGTSNPHSAAGATHVVNVGGDLLRTGSRPHEMRDGPEVAPESAALTSELHSRRWQKHWVGIVFTVRRASGSVQQPKPTGTEGNTGSLPFSRVPGMRIA